MATATSAAAEDTTLEVRRIYDATRERVFQAWTDPQAIVQWFGATDGHRCTVEAFDFRLGGRYCLTLGHPEGESGCGGESGASRAAGVFTVIEPPVRLAFTWTWEEGGMDIGESLVTVHLKELGGQTELVLTHERLPSDEARTAHGEGWNGILDRLGQFVFDAGLSHAQGQH